MAFWSNEYKHSMRGIFPPVAADIIKEKMEAAGLDPAGVSDEHENIINEVYSWGAYSPMDKFDDKESLDFSSAPAEYRDRLAKSVLENIDSFDIDEEALVRLFARMKEYLATCNKIVVVNAVSSWDNWLELPHNVYLNTESGVVDMSLEQLEKISGQDSSDLYSFDIVIKSGDMTAVYNLSEDGDRFRAQEKDLNTIRSYVVPHVAANIGTQPIASGLQKEEGKAPAKATEMTILAHDIKITPAIDTCDDTQRDSIIESIADKIVCGNWGAVTEDGVNYEWEIAEPELNGAAIEDYNMITDENKNFAEFLEGLGYSQEQISDIANAGDIKNLQIENPTMKKIESSYKEATNTAIENLAKSYAISTFTSDSENGEVDYDKFMASDCLEKTRLSIWEPFENYTFEEMQELVESEFDSALNFAKKVIAIQEKSLDIDADVAAMSDEQRKFAMDEIEGKSDRNIDLAQ